MVWAAPYLPVPKVVTLQQLGDSTILLTEALPGRDATHAAWRADLPALVRALGRGLRSFHDAVGEEWCPFRFDLARALAHVEERVRAGDISASGFHQEHAHLTPAEALAELEDTAPDDEDLVVCHGDFCPPNAAAPGGPGHRLRGPRRAGRRRSLVGRGGRCVECRLEFRGGARAPLLRELRREPGPRAHPVLPPALRPRVLTPSRPAINSRARVNTASNIGTVSLPVNVFCWLGWYEPSSVRPSGSGVSARWPKAGRGRSP